MKTNAIVVTGFGINCEVETAHAIKKTGGNATIIHLNKLLEAPSLLQTYNFLVFPGGFSYADHLGAAKVYANKIKYNLKSQLNEFVQDGKLVLGICNGFQILSKLGLLPYPNFDQTISLAHNKNGKFVDRWVRLKVNKLSPCIYTKGLEYIDAPVRHGEGQFVAKDQQILLDILNKNLHPIQYVDYSGKFSGYPYNPNGSIQNIAGICDPTGRIFGLMPHPEAYNHKTNHPGWTRYNPSVQLGTHVFKNAINYVENNF